VQPGGKQQYINTNMIKYDLEVFYSNAGFDMTIVSTKNDSTIEFVNFWGKNCDDMDVEYNDDTYEYLKNLKYRGYYVRIIGFVCSTYSDSIQINGVTLKIDGVEQQFAFETPLVHEVVPEEEFGPIMFLSYPSFISTTSIDNELYYVFSIEEDCTIDSFGFNNFYDIQELLIEVDGSMVGGKEALPLDVKKGSRVNIRPRIELSSAQPSTDFDWLYTSPMLRYHHTVDGTSKNYSMTLSLVSQGVSNEEDAKALIDYLIARES
jgi:hypothetical protein